MRHFGFPREPTLPSLLLYFTHSRLLFLFSLFAKRTMSGFSLTLKTQKFVYTHLFSVKNLYKHQKLELLVSFLGPVHTSSTVGNHCTFRLLKYPHTSRGFSKVTIFMLPNDLLKTSCSALFPRRSSWMWKQGSCTVLYLCHTTVRHRLSFFSTNCTEEGVSYCFVI